MRLALIAIAVAYALVAGLRTVSELDLGWQMATGRYILQHHEIPSKALFTYTVPEARWVYPVASGMVFHVLFLLGGFAALSWLNALACAGTTATLASSGGRATAALAVVAVPIVALRTMPRADLFTTALFAGVLVLLWRHHTGRRSALWQLPIAFLLWVNLHLGFAAGLALLGGYVLMEAGELAQAERRADAARRLRNALPWMGGAVAATLVNPWGSGIYRSIALQNQAAQASNDFIGEWSGVKWNGLAWRQLTSPRDPASADWWMLGIGAAAIAACVARRRFGAAALLAGGMYEAVGHVRFQALFAILVVVLGGSAFEELAAGWKAKRSGGGAAAGARWSAWGMALVAGMAAFAGVRMVDVATQGAALRASEISFFGAGESWWFPEKAMAFLEKAQLPGNLFGAYGMSGYLVWRVGETYPDFADGRYIPFGRELFLEQRKLVAAEPGSKAWRDAAEKWKINTVVYSVSRYAGLGTFPLAEFCRSEAWKAVYADDVSIVFVRNTAENAGWVQKYPLNCAEVRLPAPELAEGDSWRARAERFNFLLNSAGFYFLLSRDAEAAGALEQAEALFPEDAGLHLLKAQLLQANGKTAEAEAEYRRVLATKPGDEAWFALATLYNGEKRYEEAERCVRESIGYSQVAYERVRSLGLVHISMGKAQEALGDFARAEAESPFRGDTSSEEGRNFNGRMAMARARAYRAMGDLAKAVAEQERAVELMPGNAAAWSTLAELAAAQGDAAKAEAARKRVEELRAGSGKNGGE